MAKLYFYYSAMNAGKTTTLLQSSYNYNERGMDTILFTPTVDDRYEVGTIASRIGLKCNAKAFDKNFDFYESVARDVHENENIRCILVDEAQFLTKEQVHQLSDVADKLNLPVLCYGIRSDFEGEPFPGSKYLLAWAEVLQEIKTICDCGGKASMNLRVDANGDAVIQGSQVEIGGNDRYIAMCRKHFKEARDKARKKHETQLSETAIEI